eukprot:TRINITY_DN3924_c0_g1_i4.p1 TRINITY_DN3924_c0_g1~~TRINITY_DN3924_c0_g1_i4.p1  ORF type:complete len:127 (-),score=27.99 TRINITY_DN3924_c0_g1_i4:93-473(-)
MPVHHEGKQWYQRRVREQEQQIFMVKELQTKAEFDEFLKASGLVVIDFTATWCGPCHKMSPIFERFAQTYASAHFAKVDVDANSATAEACSIRAMPTFILFKNGEKVAEVVGASQDNLEKAIKAHL